MSRDDRACVKVSKKTFDSVKGFAEAMQRNTNSVIEEALGDWLNTVGYVKLEDAQITAAKVRAAFRQPICIDEYKAEHEHADGATA